MPKDAIDHALDTAVAALKLAHHALEIVRRQHVAGVQSDRTQTLVHVRAALRLLFVNVDPPSVLDIPKPGPFACPVCGHALERVRHMRVVEGTLIDPASGVFTIESEPLLVKNIIDVHIACTSCKRVIDDAFGINETRVVFFHEEPQ